MYTERPIAYASNSKESLKAVGRPLIDEMAAGTVQRAARDVRRGSLPTSA